MLIICPERECSNKVSEAAGSCPSCGLEDPYDLFKTKERTKLYKVGDAFGNCYNHLLAKTFSKYRKPMYIEDIGICKFKSKTEGHRYSIKIKYRCKACYESFETVMDCDGRCIYLE
ncbi:MAG: hypothetical protein HZA14_13050 [Nitrospirae bacterium]|nr:hypothetical protein [Nitrospirota bacterium]